jgi:anti-sigma factor RsiW
MRPVQDEELSALLDGELDPQRAEEVRTLIHADPALREEFGALLRLDARLCNAVEQVAFEPRVTFPAPAVSATRAWHWPAAVSMVLALVGIRLLPKLVELSLFGFGIQIMACAAIASLVIRMAREPEPQAARAF